MIDSYFANVYVSVVSFVVNPSSSLSKKKLGCENALLDLSTGIDMRNISVGVMVSNIDFRVDHRS